MYDTEWQKEFFYHDVPWENKHTWTKFPWVFVHFFQEAWLKRKQLLRGNDGFHCIAHVTSEERPAGFTHTPPAAATCSQYIYN